MSTTDPIADMLTRTRNALMSRHEVVDIIHSKMNVEIARILKREGYISDYAVERQGRGMILRLYLKYVGDRESVIRGLKRISKPGLRRYAGMDKITRTRQGLGTVVLSTPAGILTGGEAKRKKVGGEVLFEVW
ncbi:MAG: 30S ribosomal protein S8 [bacterium]